MARSNTRFARGIAIVRKNTASWVALDALPREVRRLIWEAPVSIDPVSASAVLDEYGDVYETLIYLRGCIDTELNLFAEEYRRKHGTSLPHSAAGAQLQRYTPPRAPRKSPAGFRGRCSIRGRSIGRWAEVAEAS